MFVMPPGYIEQYALQEDSLFISHHVTVITFDAQTNPTMPLS